jgi:hypothetical protein
MKILDVYGSAASGSAGSKTASRNRFGQYLRLRAIPTNPNTANQALIRNWFGTMATQWKALSSAQVQAWAAYAVSYPIQDALGSTVELTGNMMYQRLNMQRLRLGLAVITTPPSVNPTFATDPATQLLTTAGGFMTFSFTSSAPEYVRLEMSRVVSRGQRFFGRSEMKTIGYYSNGAAQNIMPSYTNVFGTFATGNGRVNLKVTVVNPTYGVLGPNYESWQNV